MVKRITSRQNPLVARCRALARGEGPQLLLDGVHLVAEALAGGARLREAIVNARALETDEIRELILALEARGVEVVTASPGVMEAISPVHSASDIAAIADRPVSDASRVYAGAHPMVAIACGIQDPGNLGAIVRVAEAAGASGFVSAGPSADPFGWKALRGAMGSALRLPLSIEAHVEEAVMRARQHRCPIVAAVPRVGRALFEMDFTGPFAVIIGAEGAGLPPALVEEADERVSIPMQAPVESLNAAVATALVLYEARRQRTLEAGHRP